MITPEMLARSGTEHGEQCALFCWASQHDQQIKYPQLKWMHAIPNSGARGNKIAAGQLKAEGVKAGVADVFLPYPSAYCESTLKGNVKKDFTIEGYIKQFNGLYIELKRANGFASDVTQDQLDFAAFVNENGYAWYAAFGWIEAVHIIECYLRSVKPHLTPKQQLVLNNIHA